MYKAMQSEGKERGAWISFLSIDAHIPRWRSGRRWSLVRPLIWFAFGNSMPLDGSILGTVCRSSPQAPKRLRRPGRLRLVSLASL